MKMPYGRFGLALVAMAMTGCGPTSASVPVATQTPRVVGSFTLTDSAVSVRFNTYPDGRSETIDCLGTGGYADIKTGAGVLVKDETNRTIGASVLVLDPAKTVQGRCAYTFSVNVGTATFYAIQIGQRSAVTYSASDMAAKGWKVELTLGK